MASTSGPNQTIDRTQTGCSSSYFQKTVCLHEWWLIKAEPDSNGRRLAVAGSTSRDKKAIRVFSSAPINKRYDVFTLETADGICVVIKGFINKLRTNENGFPPEVFKQFMFGFPPCWENYAVNCFEGECSNSAVSGNIFDSDKLATHITTDASIEDGRQSDKCSFSREKSQSEEEKDTHNVKLTNSGSSGLELRSLKGNDKNSPSIHSGRHRNENGKAFLCQNAEELNYTSCITNHSGGKEDSSKEISLRPVGCMTTSLSSNFSSKQRKEEKAASESKAEQVKINLVKVHTDHVTDQNNRSKSGEISISSLSDNELEVPICGNTLNEKDHECVEDGHPQKNDVKLGRNGEATSQRNNQSRTTNRSPWSPNLVTKPAHDIDVAVGEIKRREKLEIASRNKTKRKLIVDSPVSSSPITPGAEEKTCLVSPESLNYRRSRSGRLLVPTLEFWRNQIPVYDANHGLTGIQDVLPKLESRGGSRSEPRKNKVN